MAHFAELNENNYVLRVVRVGDDIETSDGPLGDNDMHVDGETWCTNFFGGTWKQTSFSGSFRNMYAAAESYYDASTNEFYPPKPYASWTLSDNKQFWEAPIGEPPPPESPEDFNPIYAWDENIGTWVGTIDDGQTRHQWDVNTLSWIPLS